MIANPQLMLIHGRYFNSWEALGLGYIASYVRQERPVIDLTFGQGALDTDAELLAQAIHAQWVAFSCTSPAFPHAVRLARQIKAHDPQIRTIVGGYHASAVPQACLVAGIDQVVVGEGEAALVEILDGNTAPIIYGRPMDMAELPWPDRVLIRNERNIQVAYADTGLRISSFQSHRACPFQCVFCADGANKVLYGGRIGKAPVRYRPVADLVAEMAAVTATYQLDLLKFSDPTWNTSIPWVVDFCREKVALGLTTPFYANIHATLTTDAMAEAMARAGCRQVAIGVESGSPRILQAIGKGTSRAAIQRCVASFRQAGIQIRGYFLVGMPQETAADLQMTADFAAELDLDEYGFTILCPYPGTLLYDPAVHAALDWEHTDEYSNDFWRTETLTNAELKSWQARLGTQFGRKLTWHNQVLLAGASEAQDA